MATAVAYPGRSVLVATLSRSDWIALGAVLIAAASLIVALFSLALAWRADARAGRGEERDERGEERAVEQHAAAQADAADARRADLRITPGLAVPDGSDRRRYAVEVQNIGRGRADEVRVTVEDQNGETVSAQSTLLLSLAGGESAQTAVWMLRDVAARPGLCFAISWRDDEDKHVRTDVGLFQ